MNGKRRKQKLLVAFKRLFRISLFFLFKNIMFSKPLKNQLKRMKNGSPDRSWGTLGSWAALGPSWPLLGRSWQLLAALSSLLAALGTL